MLILTRKSDESVIIANNIEVKILSVRGDQVSIGFSAPREVSIYRKEVYDAIQQENRQAASINTIAMNKIKASLELHRIETTN